MKVVGAYVSWIDISYIANDKFSRSVSVVTREAIVMLFQFVVEVPTSGTAEGECV